ncbi:MAG: hypothetical protein K2W85_06465 [Phycisphaerales bacterium]|nr:hypothetical protein [Phycisphaerales bacterium]
MSEHLLPPPRDQAIYVNYLPMPVGIHRFLKFAVPAVLWIMCALAFVWARSQYSPGNAVWETGKPVEFMGVLGAAPYPVLFTPAKDGTITAVLLVEQGKFGTQKRAAALSGQLVRVSGWLLHREGRQILELEPEDRALVRITDAAITQAPTLRELGSVTVRGEIVDGKCYLGAMKPGAGKTHKECATLCIRGGIPPIVIAFSADGSTEYLLLQSESGEAIDPALHHLIADPVEIRGVKHQWLGVSGLGVLRVRAADVRRL